MKFSLSRALIIARREYVTTVRRKAFLFSLLLTPALMALSVTLQLAGSDDARKHAHQERVVALVDSSGVFADAPAHFDFRSVGVSVGGKNRFLAPDSFVVPLVARPFPALAPALDSLSAGTVNTVIVVPPDFLATGNVRRYEHDTRTLTESGDDRAVRVWLTRSMLGGGADSLHAARVIGLGRSTDLYVPGRDGTYALKDDMRELWSFMVPFVMALILGIAIITGGQYLLQGVSEEKETRILESLLCTVTPDDLMVGKLIGLGGAGLTLVGAWIVAALYFAAPTMGMLQISIPPVIVVLAIAYFVLGYLFYASLMTGIGAIANNLREAQQLAMIFTITNFLPFYAIAKILNNPHSSLTVGLSLFPMTAPTTMMLRLATSSITGAEVPLWQIGASIGLLAAAAFLAVRASSKIFRIGLLLYGKTPNLPEILAILRQK